MYPNWNGKEKIMFPSNPSFVEKLVQTKQEEIEREIRGFDEREFLNFQKPIIKIALKPKVLRFVGVMALLAWLIMIVN